jgi:glycoside/pentoside/hexuronide:cation symporter, GPH family
MRPSDHGPGLIALLGYAAPALPLALLTLPFYVIVPNAYVALGAPLTATGYVLLAIRLMDAVTDPMMGALADATRARMGRKVWFAIGAPITALAAVMLFSPPPQMQGVGYLALWATVMSLGWTITIVPYSAWGAELATGYEARSRIAAFRETAVFIGTLLALVLPEVVRQAFGDESVASIRSLGLFALVIGAGLPLAAMAAFLLTPERLDRSTTRPPLRQAWRDMIGNAQFLWLIAAFLINGFANGLPATLFLFFIQDRLQLAADAGIFLIVYFAAGLAGVPVWLWLARRMPKQRAWAAGMLLACLGFLAAPFLPPGSYWPFMAVCLVTGLAVGADLVLPPSLQADVIALDTAKTGAEKSASYMAAWSLATKLALALAVGLAFPLLAASGYEPSQNLKSDSGLLMLALLYAALPIALKLVAIAVVLRLTMDRETQKAAEETIRKAQLRNPVARPTSAK